MADKKEVAIPGLLRRARAKSMMTVEEMANALEIPVTSYQYYESSKYKKTSLPGPMAEKILRILHDRGIRLDQASRALLFGISPTEIGAQVVISNRDLYEGEAPPRGYLAVQELFVSEEGKLRLPRLDQDDEKNDSIELSGPSLFPTLLIERLATHVMHLRCSYVVGDGMHPTLQGADVILVNVAQVEPSPPGIFIIFDGVNVLAKRLEVVPGKGGPKIRILSDNPAYSSYETEEEVRIIGRIVWFSRIVS